MLSKFLSRLRSVGKQRDPEVARTPSVSGPVDPKTLSKLLIELVRVIAQGQGESFVATHQAVLDPSADALLDAAARAAAQNGNTDLADTYRVTSSFLQEQRRAHEQDRLLGALKMQPQFSRPSGLAEAVNELLTGLHACESVEQVLRLVEATYQALLAEHLDDELVTVVANARSGKYQQERTAQRLLEGRDVVRLVQAQGFVATLARVRRMHQLQLSNLFIVLMGPLTTRDRRTMIMENAKVLAKLESQWQFNLMMDVLREQNSDREIDARVKGMKAFLPVLRERGVDLALKLPEVQSMLADDGETRITETGQLLLRRAARLLRNASSLEQRSMMLYAYRDLFLSDAMSDYFDEVESELSAPSDEDAIQYLRTNREMMRRCHEVGIEAALDSVRTGQTAPA